MRKSFLLYKNLYEPVRNLTTEQKGILFDAVYKFQLGEDFEIQDITVKMAFQFFEQIFMEDHKKYIKKCLKNQENARKRWDKQDANACERNRTYANYADKEKDKEKEKDNDKGLEKIVSLSTKSFK